MIWLKYGYVAFCSLYALGALRLWLSARRYEPHSSELLRHDGTSLPDDHIVFSRPSSELGIIRSVGTSLTTASTAYHGLTRAIAGAIFGAAIVAPIVWYGPIHNVWLASLLFAGSALLLSLGNVVGTTQSCSFVGADGLQWTKSTAGRWYEVPHSQNEICFDDVLDISHYNGELFLHTFQPTFGQDDHGVFIIGSSIQRGHGWSGFSESLFKAFLEVLWSRALLELATCQHDRNQPNPDDFTGGLPDGVRCYFLPDDWLRAPRSNLLTSRTNRISRIFDGYLMFHSEGLILDRTAFTSCGGELNKRAGEQYTADEIEKIECTEGLLTLNTTRGDLCFPELKIPKAPLLVRLFESGIWDVGLDSIVESEMEKDLAMLRDAGWSPETNPCPYWDLIPAHRMLVFDAASTLGFSAADATYGIMREQAMSFRSDGVAPNWTSWKLRYSEENVRDRQRRCGAFNSNDI